MPRKNPLSDREAGICDRLKLFREDLKLSRVAFAIEAGIDSSLLLRYEHKRVPLKYESAWKVISAFPLNPQWLADCEGREMMGFQLPSPDELHVSRSALFSEVYDSSLRDLVRNESIKIDESFKEFKKRSGRMLTIPDTKGRYMAEEILFERLRIFIASICDSDLNDFVEKVDREIFKIAGTFSFDSAAIRNRRLRATELYRASWAMRQKMLDSSKIKKSN